MAKPRSIFEEVGSEGQSSAPAPTKLRKEPRAGRKGVVGWLILLFALVFAMIVVGGLTRLTDSGLSITEWKPVLGAMPPANEAAWTEEFEKYKAIPQYELINQGMTLDGFKSIYWWEWGHRQLGRVVGLVWALGFFWFLVRGHIPRGWTGRLLGLGALGGLQGLIGWWMVSSGLGDGMVAVASYRLAVHLGLAFSILGLIAWYVLYLSRAEAELLQARRQRKESLITWGTVLIVVVFLQIILGALVAGIDAGRGYIDWPLMAGQVFPSEAFDLEPLWKNLLENPALVQFNHRVLGYLLAILVVLAWLRSRKTASAHVRGAFLAVIIALAAQMALGIFTVLHASPWQIAIVHQVVAVVLFVLIIRARFAAGYPRAQQISRS